LAGLGSKSNVAAGRFYTTSCDEDQLSSHLGKLRAQYDLYGMPQDSSRLGIRRAFQRPDGIIVAVLDIYP
jgi:hypothetical protein